MQCLLHHSLFNLQVPKFSSCFGLCHPYVRIGVCQLGGQNRWTEWVHHLQKPSPQSPNLPDNMVIYFSCFVLSPHRTFSDYVIYIGLKLWENELYSTNKKASKGHQMYYVQRTGLEVYKTKHYLGVFCKLLLGHFPKAFLNPLFRFCQYVLCLVYQHYCVASCSSDLGQRKKERKET